MLAETANRPSAATQRQRIYDLIAMSVAGLTDDEMQDWLSMNGNTQRPRRRELELAGKIRKAGTRINRNGNVCTV